MLNLLKDYISDSLPESNFTTAPALLQKVDAYGSFLEFYGNTLVFLLDDTVMAQLAALQRQLYEAAPQMLAQPIDPAAFHMTLHDLINSTEDTPALRQRMHQVKAEIVPILTKWRGEAPLHLRGTWLFNMVNTSIVLGLEPADQASAARLGDMYACIENVVPLGYALTPHITLAYFRPGTYDNALLGKLKQVLRPVQLEVTLTMDKLVLQEFTDMNHYVTIP